MIICPHCNNLLVSNKNRDDILRTIQQKKIITMSYLKEKLKLNYKTIWDHVKSLEKVGLVKLEQNEKLAGKPLMINRNQ